MVIIVLYSLLVGIFLGLCAYVPFGLSFSVTADPLISRWEKLLAIFFAICVGIVGAAMCFMEG